MCAESGEQYSNSSGRRPWLTSGILLGALVAILVLVITVSKLNEFGRRDGCHIILRSIGAACASYSGDYDHCLPSDLGLLYPRYIDNASMYSCPSRPSEWAGITKTGPVSRETTSFVYVAGLRDNDPPDCVLAFDRPGNHGRAGVHVLFVGARVRWMREAELRKALAETRELARKDGREIRLVGE